MDVVQLIGLCRRLRAELLCALQESPLERDRARRLAQDFQSACTALCQVDTRTLRQAARAAALEARAAGIDSDPASDFGDTMPMSVVLHIAAAPLAWDDANAAEDFARPLARRMDNTGPGSETQGA